MSAVIDRVVREMPLATKGIILDEWNYDPHFGQYFTPLALSSNPEKNIDAAMTKALINELAPHRYPESKGRWPVLRDRFRDGLARVRQITSRFAVPGPHEPGFLMNYGAEDFAGLGLTPLVTAITEGAALGTKRATGVAPTGASGMGWLDIAATLASSLIAVGGSVYTARLQKKLQESQQKHEQALVAADARREEEARKRAEAEAQAARAAAAAAGKPLPGTPEFKAAEEEKAWPSWLTYALIAALGVGGFFVIRSLVKR